MIHIFADLETYSAKYFKEKGYIKPYVVMSKGYKNDHFKFDVDIKMWLLELIEELKNNTTVWFHYGGKFDLHFILPLLYELTFDGLLEEKQISYFINDKKNIFDITISKKIKFKNKKTTRQRTVKLHFNDSYKIWPRPLSALGQAVGMPKLDYGEYDILTEFKTKQDYIDFENGKAFEYLHRDVDILLKFAEETSNILPLSEYKTTIASTAYTKFLVSNQEFDDNAKWWFFENENYPTDNALGKLEVWTLCKQAYRGGFTFTNPLYQKKLLNNIYVYDVNSLYPYIMLDKKLPYDTPRFFENKIYTYSFYQVVVKYAKAEIPFIQSSKKVEDFLEIDIEDPVELDKLEEEYPKELFNEVFIFDKYQLASFEKYYKGEWSKDFLFAFKEKKGTFDSYITHFRRIKENEKGAKREIAKLFLNSLYGKFGQNIRTDDTIIKTNLEVFGDKIIYPIKKNFYEKRDKNGYLILKKEIKQRKNGNYYVPGENLEEKTLADFGKNLIENPGITWYDDGKTKTQVTQNRNIFYLKNEGEITSNPKYIPMACSITSQARAYLIEAIYQNKENFVYCDTDSIHLKKEAKGIDFDENIFGKWKFEGRWDKAVYRRAKHYYHLNNDYKHNFVGTEEEIIKNNKNYEIKGGGFNVKKFNPDNLTLEEYLQPQFIKQGGKTKAKIVDGGVIIVEDFYTFTMPSWWIKNEKNK